METESRPAQLDFLALCLLAFALLSLNSAVLLLTLIPNFFSLYVALPITLYLIARYSRISNIGDIFGLFLLFFAIFLFGSTIPALAGHNIDLDRLRQYAITVIFVSGVYFWAATLSDAALVTVLRIAKGMLLIASLTTIFSTQLAGFFQYDLGPERAFGFFGQPNNAAFAALYCLVLVVAYPARSLLLTLAQGSIAVAAMIMTFSRAGILIFLLLCLLFLLYRPSKGAIALFLIGMILFIPALWSVFEYDLFDLSGLQRRRLADILDLLIGQTDVQNTGKRVELWEIGVDRIAKVFPLGAGIGQFHYMEYSHRGGPTGSIWLGVHNAYLMILGEAGLPAFIAFLAFWATIIWKSVKSEFGVFALGATAIFLSSMVSTHGILVQRAPDVMLALLMAVAARSRRSR